MTVLMLLTAVAFQHHIQKVPTGHGPKAQLWRQPPGGLGTVLVVGVSLTKRFLTQAAECRVGLCFVMQQ